MTAYTAMLIAENDSVYASSWPQDGKYCLYIGMMDKAPSGWERPRDLLTSKPIFDSADAAKQAGEKIIADVKAAYYQMREDHGPNGDATTPGFFK